MSQVYVSQVLLMANTFTRRAAGMPATGACSPSVRTRPLFALIGTTYGGNGTSTFAPAGPAQPRAGRDRPGARAVELPARPEWRLRAGDVAGVERCAAYAHRHVSGDGPIRVGRRCPSSYPPPATTWSPTTTVAPNIAAPLAALAGVSVQPNSGGTPFSVLQPYLALNYCIALQGIFPSRS